MIISRGAGYLVFVIVFGCSLVAQLVTDRVSGTPDYWRSHAWPFASALVAAGTIVWPIGLFLSRRPARTLVDVKTGERVEMRPEHDLFFIPIKYWTAILMGIAIVVVLLDRSPGEPPDSGTASADLSAVPPK